jgi:hypothetical protein
MDAYYVNDSALLVLSPLKAGPSEWCRLSIDLFINEYVFHSSLLQFGVLVPERCEQYDGFDLTVDTYFCS